jgi:hypothetical protein
MVKILYYFSESLVTHFLGIRDLFNLGSKMEKFISGIQHLYAVLRIRIYRIHVFLGLPDPDPLVRGMDPDPAQDPDPSIIMQKY